MKLKYLFTSLFVVFLFLISRSSAFAACDAQIASWDPNTRNLQVCVGGFTSVDQLKATTADFHCISNSNFPSIYEGPSACYRVTGGIYSLSATQDTVANSDGTYYTCITGQGLSRGIGSLKVNFSGGQSCSTEAIITKPSDWNPLTEGTIFSGEPGRTGGGSEVECVVNGSKGINTALGCISYDATSGGFVRSLLGIIIGLGGGVALLLILYGVFIVTTSAGIPEKLKEGKELITSAIAGLLFIIMAIFLMNLIGIQLLAIPGLQ